MDIERIKQIPIVNFLARLGHAPVRQRGSEVWFRAPYRPERTPSFCVNTEKNLWMDFGTGTGGDIFTLAGEMVQDKDFIAQARFIEEKAGSPLAAMPNCAEPVFHDLPAGLGFENVEVLPLRRFALTGYLAERGIPTNIAVRYCYQLNYRVNGKPYFAVGFPNMTGGYELRNRFFKGCVPPKDVSLVKVRKTPATACNVFEGFMDFLSAMTLSMVKAEDSLVLNSVANIKKAVSCLASYNRIDCYLDRDEAGKRTLETLRRYFGGNVKDYSGLYQGHKDLNDYLKETRK